MKDIIHTFIQYNPLWFLQPLLIFVRLLACFYSINEARKHNKNLVKWGLLGFLLPLIAVLWILYKFPKPADEELTDCLTIDQN